MYWQSIWMFALQRPARGYSAAHNQRITTNADNLKHFLDLPKFSHTAVKYGSK